MAVSVVMNPRARQVAVIPGLASRVMRSLKREGLDCELTLTQAPGHATELAREAVARGDELLVVAGGDGTVNEVVNGLQGSDVALGLIPLGTGNVLGRMLGLRPGDVEGACQWIGRREVRTLDLGQINGRVFVNMAGAGLDAQVADRLPREWQTALGAHGFVWSFVRVVLETQPWEFSARIDGQVMSGRMWGLFVCNTPQYTWRVRMAPDARPDDGLLEFVFLFECTREELLQVSAALFVQGLSAETQQPIMQVVRGRRLELTCDPPAPWQVEGEVGGFTPAECCVLPASLRLVAGPQWVGERALPSSAGR